MPRPERISIYDKMTDDERYAFYLNGRYNRSQGNMFADPRAQLDFNEYTADLFSLGEIGLYVGRSIHYLFDFGDNWEFVIEVTGTTESVEKRTRKKHQLIQSVGKAPAQYRSWDEV